MRINIISEEKQIYKDRNENGQGLKLIEFKLPIMEKEFTLNLDNAIQMMQYFLYTGFVLKRSTGKEFYAE